MKHIHPLACLALAAACLPASIAPAQQINLMPMPRSIHRNPGALTLTPAHGLSHLTYGFAKTHDPRLQAAATRMIAQLDRTCGGDIRRSATQNHPAAPTLSIDVANPGEKVQSLDENESYTLTVTPKQATLTAPNDLGALHGMQTILQLASYADGACVLPAVSIEDAPRFPWRGLHLDVSRHFEPIPVIKRTLDGMAVAKLNVFHWHLSDDQGFRAQLLNYPKLTQDASDGHFYTQDQMRAIVAYARARGIRVVPEFDMPGHSSSTIHAYPKLGSGEIISKMPTTFGIPVGDLDPTRPSTYKYVNDLVSEMSKIFPDAYFHIGGDETPGTDWMANPRIRKFMAKKGFTTPAQLQAYFNQRIEPILAKHGKKMIGWDEILNPDLPKSITIQSWRGVASLSRAARLGYHGILSAPYYLDAQKSSAQMFLADPIPADTTLTPAQQKLILGGEIAMWAEQIDPETVDSRIWPRSLAIAERFWSPQSDRDVSYMYQRLRPVSLELENAGLTHISGPQKLRRNLARTRHPQALDLLASVVEPVSFGERYQGQHTDAFTELDRLVDAVVADPPSRQQIAGDVQAIAGKQTAPASTPANPPAKNTPNTDADVPQGFPPRRRDAIADLHRRFQAWQNHAPELLALAAKTPRLNDTAPLALDLTQLGGIGIQALTYIQSRTPAPAAWATQSNATIAQAQKGAALVRFTFLPSLRKLVAAAQNQKPRSSPEPKMSGNHPGGGQVP